MMTVYTTLQPSCIQFRRKRKKERKKERKCVKMLKNWAKIRNICAENTHIHFIGSCFVMLTRRVSCTFLIENVFRQGLTSVRNINCVSSKFYRLVECRQAYCCSYHWLLQEWDYWSKTPQQFITSMQWDAPVTQQYNIDDAACTIMSGGTVANERTEWPNLTTLNCTNRQWGLVYQLMVSSQLITAIQCRW